MTTIEYTKERPNYFNVLADGKFHLEVPEGTEGAVRRDYETSDKKQGFKWELLAETITGKIVEITKYEGDFGTSVIISFEAEGDEKRVVVSLSANGNFGEDFLKKLNNIKTDVEVSLSPFSFEDGKGKKRKGISIVQNGEKIQSYYSKKGEDGKWTEINGYPQLPPVKINKKTKEIIPLSKVEWKVYFGQARIFMLEELEKHPLFKEQSETVSKVWTGNDDKEEVNPDDIPF
jgi:hypothetical protein